MGDVCVCAGACEKVKRSVLVQRHGFNTADVNRHTVHGKLVAHYSIL